MRVDWQQLLRTNTQRLGVAKINRLAMADAAASEAVSYRSVYEAAVAGTSIPWWWVAAIDYREESWNHNDYLGNGQPLNQRTTEVPAGRGPFANWQAGAADSLKAVDLSVVGFPPVGWSDWSLAGAATAAELWNGPGYAERGRPSPYVWAATTIYTGGLYTSDGHYDPSKLDPRAGVVAIWQAMQLQGVNLGFPASHSAGTATPAVPSHPAPAGVAGHSAAVGLAAAGGSSIWWVLKQHGESVMFDILVIVGVLAICYLIYWAYVHLWPTAVADASKVAADVQALKPTAAPAKPVGPTGATGA